MRIAGTRIHSLRTALAALGLTLALCGRARAWEGHEWEKWREVTTWQKPALETDQAGKSELAPLLGGGGGAADRPLSIEEWKIRREQYAKAIAAILGEPTNLAKPEVEVRELGDEETEFYTRRHLMIRSEAEDWIPAYLLIPKKLAAPRAPAMICLHQTVAQGKEEPCGIKGDPELAFADELAKRGFVCIAPDAIGFGERIPAGTQPYHDSLAFYRRHPGWSFMGKMIWDVQRVVDYLETLPFVDAARIGSIGHSHGAYGTLFAAAFEPRVSGAVASCGFTTFRSDPNPERWSHLTALIPQLGFYLPDAAGIPFDWQHVLALAAPRRLFVWYATQDSIFPNTENLGDLLTDVRRVYELDGAGNGIEWQAFEGPHKFPKEGREKAYAWLEAGFAEAAPSAKTRSAFYPRELVARAQANAAEHAWAAAIRDPLVAAAQPWMELSDDHLWGLMFGNTIKRAWQVWSDGHCPSCKQPVPMYEWAPDALKHPWKMRCPKCKELFPKNDFQKFYESGLNEQGLFEPARADRALLFNAEHRDPGDPLHKFGVDDGDGYVEGNKRWRFINAYLIFGQWKQAIVDGIRKLAAAYVATGDAAYAHKAGVLLDRAADFYPTFDFGKEGVMYEGPPRSGYVSTWHDACMEVQELALAYDAVFEALANDAELVSFLSAKAAKHKLDNPKASFADIQRNIEDRIFRDTLANRPKIESNYPMTDVAIATMETVLGWPGNREEVMDQLDAIIAKATAVDGMTGEKGIAGYTVLAPHLVAGVLGRYSRAEPGFIEDALRRHPRLHAMYRFHIDTWCLGQYYPRTGDTGSFAERNPAYAGLAFTTNPGIGTSSYAFLWDLYRATGDADFARILYGANGASAEGLPYDLFAADPAAFQAGVAKVIEENGAEIKLGSVNKSEWGLAILRSGSGADARAAWLDYDSGERHGHADGMTIGLFAKGLDLLPDFGYPPVQYGGWTAPRSMWYMQTAAHNTISVDGKNTLAGAGKTTLWFEGKQFRSVRVSGPALIGGGQFERTVALVDISERDSYVLDIFRAAGGEEHTKFSHGHFGRMIAKGLSPAPKEETRYGEVMRNIRVDPAPAPGWSADWAAEDHLKYLEPGRRIHLRQTELTRGAEAELAEAWVAVGLYGGTAEAWIPSVIVRRKADAAPLASTFAAILEPYESKSNIAAARRLKVIDAEGRELGDDCVGIEVKLADGRRDLILSRNVEAGGSGTILEEETGARFEGDLCIIRFDTSGRPERAIFCNAKKLELRGLVIVAAGDAASFELDLDNKENPIAAGPGGDVEMIEIEGARVWPR